MTGKGFSAEEGDGQYLWSAVTERLNSVPETFRLTITDRRCAVSGEKTLPILDAAHIHAFEAGGEHAASNGLLLRTDIQWLFDLGYVTVSPDRRFEVSGRLKADFDNGRHYYDLHGTPIRASNNRHAAPSADALSWHREHRYLG